MLTSIHGIIASKLKSLGFTEKQILTASDKAAGDSLGRSIAVSGNIMVVGARNNDPSGVSNAGAAYIYEKSGGTWSEVKKITANVKAVDDNFGFSVAIDGNIIVVGAANSDPSGNSNAGAAYIFEKAGTWPATETKKITASDGAASDFFGSSVAISGTIVVVGANGNDPGSPPLTNAGAAYIFEKAGTWPATETKKITNSDNTTITTFGRGVSISGTTVVVGANEAAYIFEKAGTWPATETKKITASDAAASDAFAGAVSISGTIVVVGAGLHDDGVNNAGAAYIYEKSGGTWPATETKKITASDRAAFDQFGSNVSISGTTIVVGVIFHADSISAAGAIYVFEKGTNWPTNETYERLASDAAANDFLGEQVSIDGTVIAVGAQGADPGGLSGAGKAYIFEK